MSKKTAEIYITCNTQAPAKAIKILEDRMAALSQRMEVLKASGKSNATEMSSLRKQYNDLLRTVDEVNKELADISVTTNDLSSRSLRELSAAARRVKNDMRNMGENDPMLETRKEQLAAITRQMERLSADYVNMGKVMANLGSVSDKVLEKAIRQQTDEVNALDRTNAGYEQQLSILRLLREQQAGRVINNGEASAAQIAAARDRLVQLRPLVAPDDENRLRLIDNYIAQADQRLASLNGTISVTTGNIDKMVSDAAAFAKMPGTISEMETRLKQMQTALKGVKPGTDEFTKLSRAIAQMESTIELSKGDVKDLSKLLANLPAASMNQLRAAAAALEKQLAATPDRAGREYRQLESQLRQVKDQMKSFNGVVEQNSRFWNAAVQSIKMYFGVFMLINQIKSAFDKIFKGNLKLSDQLADIRKVSGLTTEQINQLQISLNKIDTRSSVESLNQLAYAGARLGMGKYGVDGLSQFAAAADKVNVALHEDLGDEALTQLSKMTEVMGLIDQMGVERALEATGSAIFKLASTSTANGEHIVQMAQRIVGLGKASHMTTDQILALGSAADSMMLMPEVAATAMSKLITALQTNFKQIEKDLQLPENTLKSLLEAGDTMGAIMTTLQAMSEKGGMNALDFMFKDLGSDGARLKNVLVTMSQNMNILNQHVETSRDAFREAIAVTQEYNIQQETAQALMERASNMWSKAFINPEGIDLVKEFAQAWYDMSQTITQSSIVMASFGVVIKGVFLTLRMLVSLLPSVIAYFGTGGLVAVVRTLGSGLMAMSAKGFIPLLAHMGNLIKATKLFNVVIARNPIGFAVAGIVALISAVKRLTSSTEEAVDAQQHFNDSLDNVHQSMAEATAKLESYYSAARDAAEGTAQRNIAIQNFNNEFGGYLKNLLTEKSTVDDLRKAYEQVNLQLQAKAINEARAKDVEDIVNPHLFAQNDWQAKYQDAIQRSLYGGWDKRQMVNQVKEMYATMAEEARKEGRRVDGKAILSAIAGQIGQGDVAVNQAWMGRRDELQYITSNGTSYIRDVYGTNRRGDNKYRNQAEEALQYAARFVDEYIQQQEAMERVNRKYADLADLLEDAAKAAPDRGNAEFNEKANKAEERKAREEAQRSLTEGKNDISGVIANIKSFYEQQKTAILRALADPENKMDERVAEDLEMQMADHMDRALAEARKAIRGVENDWEYVMSVMGADLREETDEAGLNLSKTLLKAIQDASIPAIRRRVLHLANILGKDGDAIIDEVLLGGIRNDKAIASRAARRRQAQDAAMREDEFATSVDYDYRNKFQQLDFSPLSEEEMAQIGRGGLDARVLLNARMDAINEMFRVARENMIELYALSPSDQEGIFTLLFGEDYETKLNALPGLLSMDAEQTRLFYNTLVKYGDDYSEALKKSHERQEKIFDYRWMTNKLRKQLADAVKVAEGKMEEVQRAVEEGREPGTTASRYSARRPDSLWQQSGFADIIHTDPELAVLRLKMELARQEFEEAKRQNLDRESMQKRRLAYMQTEIDLMKRVAAITDERYERLQKWMDPIAESGTALGAAFATLQEDVDEGQKAIGEAIKSMVNAYGQMTIKLITDWLTQRLQQKLKNREMEIEENRHILAMQNAQDAQGIMGETRRPLNSRIRNGEGDGDIVAEQEAENALLDEVTEEGMKKVEKTTTKWWKRLFRVKQQQKKKEKDLEQSTADELVDITEAGGDLRTEIVEQTTGAATQALVEQGAKMVTAHKAQATENAQTDVSEAEVSTLSGIAGGAAKTIGQLGWWGIPLVAVITALLNGLLSYAMSSFSKLFGGKSSTTNVNTKLVSGMLTYDQGNVQQLVVGNDGHVYNAEHVDKLSTGLVTRPVATTINGQPSLVGERGPEIVIGRETTRDMRLNRPDLLADIIRFDRRRSGRAFRTYDEGNVSELSASMPGSAQTPVSGQTSEGNPEAAALVAVLSMLNRTLASMQQEGISANVNMFGNGGLYRKWQQAHDFYKNKG